MKKVKTVSDLDIHEFLLLYRHWKWADRVRDQYLKEKEIRGVSLFFEPKSSFMFVWYGLLYALLEFLGKNQCLYSIQHERN